MTIRTTARLSRTPFWQVTLAWIVPAVAVSGILFSSFPLEGQLTVQAVAVPLGFLGSVLWRFGFADLKDAC